MYSKTKYVRGSLAEQEQTRPDIYDENVVLRQIKTNKRHRKNNTRVLLAVGIFTVMLGALIYRYSYMTELNYSVERAKNELNVIENKNSLVKIDIEKSVNLNAIRREAMKKLKMRNPTENQKVYVRVVRDDISVVNDTGEN